jgi:anti-anti-sigma factor
MSANRLERGSDPTVLNLSGPLNGRHADAARQLFGEISERGVERVVVNLREVPFIDSRGLATLIAGYKVFGGRAMNFRLAAVQDQPQLVLELTGFDQVFEVSTS